MTIDMLVTKLKLSGFEFIFPPGKTIQSKFVRVGRKKVGVYTFIKGENGLGLKFKFNDQKMAETLEAVGKSMKASTFMYRQGIIIYPFQINNSARSK